MFPRSTWSLNGHLLYQALIAFAHSCSDENRDALDRVVAELSLSYEEHEAAYESGRPYEHYYDLRFGEPGWFDVTHEESG